MGFKQVFYALREVFPQVDLRILKAVASQYSSDVDAAIEFVLSDVLPAVSEPTEAHYTLEDINCAKNDHTGSGSSGSFLKRNVSPGYGGPLCTNNKSEECSQIEDKVVINETRITPTVDCAQLGASSTSATKPLIDYEQYAYRGKMPLKPLYMQSPSDCAVKYRGQMPLKLPKAESTHDFSESEDYYNLENLFANVCPTEDGQASVNLLGASTVHTLSESEDNYDLQNLFEKEMPLKLSEDECIRHFFKSEDNYNLLDTLFVEFRSSEGTRTSDSLPSAPTVQTLSESADSYDLQVLFEKEIPLELSTAQSIHDLSKSEDNFDLQVLFENIDSGGKELHMLHTAESTPELHNSTTRKMTYFENRAQQTALHNYPDFL